VDAITDKQLQFILPPTNARPRMSCVIPPIHEAFNSWIFPDKMIPGRPIVNLKMLPVSLTVFINHLQWDTQRFCR